ncbi:MAG: hypothetical protein ABI707_12440 [Ferruginibacter sp.]
MKKLFLIVLAVIAFQNLSFAKIRRVGFFASPVSGTDYSTFATAYTAAIAGDTILVFPGIPAINQTFTKKIITIGPGSWLDATSTPKGNANLQAFAGTVGISNITFSPGSEGSVITGLEGGTIYIAASNITIRRNRELIVYLAYTNPAATITNIQLLENYRINIANYFSNGSSITNINVSNNFITAFTTGALNTYSGNISNNVWAADNALTATNGGANTMSNFNNIELGGGAYLFQNNILVSHNTASLATSYNYFSFSNASNTVFNNNMALQTGTGPAQTWGVGTGNIITPFANAANIFDGFPAIGSFSADARYRLKSGSPALTAGAGGTPIGMFTGNTPYKLGMIPSIPSIYLLSSPQGNNPAGNTIQINVSTRGNN